MIYHKGATQIDQCAHRLMEFNLSPDWHGSTVVGDYIAYYHEEKLYTVRHLKKGVSCLVYARSPYDAIEKVRAIDAPPMSWRELANNSQKVGRGFGEWSKFKTRPLDEEEQAEHPDWCYILDCPLPDDGQEVLVSNGRYVWTDTFCNEGDSCYLDSNGDLEYLWWMPLPEPPKEGE